MHLGVGVRDMDLTATSRPFMPGYGTQGPTQGTGLLPWSWALERLGRSHDYWLASVTPEGRPHVMPVCDDRLWFSSSRGSRKARNLLSSPRCSLATDDPSEPVVAEGRVELVTERERLKAMLAAEKAKYDTDYALEMMDPETSCCFAFSCERVFGLISADFTGSPTRWSFDR